MPGVASGAGGPPAVPGHGVVVGVAHRAVAAPAVARGVDEGEAAPLAGPGCGVALLSAVIPTHST